MTPDRHRLWRDVKRNLEHVQAHAPDGYEAVVDVFVYGRDEPVRIGLIETTRDDWPWALMQTFESGDDSPDRQYSRDLKLVFAPTESVTRVEIHYARTTGHPTGFSHRVLESTD